MSFLLSPVPRLQFIDQNGHPYANGSLKTYQAGTLTPLATFADASGTLNPTTIVLDAAGRATVYLDTVGYKFQLFDADNNLVFTQDNIVSNFVTTTGVSLLQNKILDDTNVITVKDSNFTIENAGSTTKKFRFDAGSITSGVTRLVTIPDANLTLAGQDLRNLFSKRQEWKQGSDVSVAANALTLGDDGNVFNVGGTGPLRGITISNWQFGSIIILAFGASMTLENENATPPSGTAKLLLQGRVDETVASGDTRIFYYNASGVWAEIGRTNGAVDPNAVQTVVVTLTNAQIKALPTTSIDIIVAPGAGKYVQVLDTSFYLDPSAGAYTNVNAAAVFGLITKNGLTAVSDRANATMLNQGTNKVLVHLPGGTLRSAAGVHDAYIYSDNDGVVISANNSGSGDFTGGNAANSMKVFVTYQIRSIT